MSSVFDIFKKLEAGRTAEAATPISHLIVGLGNPGNRYRLTRHNTGFLCLDTLCDLCGAVTDRSKFHALVGETHIAGERVLFMRPQTYMNASGEAVAEAASFFRIPPERILVLCDDINLPVGAMRLRRKGSDGGQKGLRSITEELGSEDFPRLRFGVGAKPHPDYDLADWVLSTFAPSELDTLKALFREAVPGIEALIHGDTEKAVQLCSRKPPKPEP